MQNLEQSTSEGAESRMQLRKVVVKIISGVRLLSSHAICQQCWMNFKTTSDVMP